MLQGPRIKTSRCPCITRGKFSGLKWFLLEREKFGWVGTFLPLLSLFYEKVWCLNNFSSHRQHNSCPVWPPLPSIFVLCLIEIVSPLCSSTFCFKRSCHWNRNKLSKPLYLLFSTINFNTSESIGLALDTISLFTFQTIVYW